ncbi:histidine phosphatase family protein [Bacteriovoracaceae bacterium]|nr:histidine phosphatase family protein [Bacteriovoracaceae bacterium]
MTKIYMFRHGETNWNLQKRLQGHTDIELNDKGREQARELRTRLIPYDIDILLSSDLARAQETAKIVFKHRDLETIITPDLREMEMGQATGLTRDELIERFGKVWDEFLSPKKEHLKMCFPGGETKQVLLDRTLLLLEKYAKDVGSMAISTHGGVLLKMIQYSLDYSENEIIRVENCSCFVFELKEKKLSYIKKI